MKLYHIALCESRESYAITHKKVSWASMAKRLQTFKRTGETYSEYLALSKDAQLAIKDSGGFLAGNFKGFLRRKANQIGRCMLTLDLDEIPVNADQARKEISTRLKDYTYVCHSTHKHCFAKPRLRIVIPLSRDANAIEHEALARLFAYILDSMMEWVDRCSFDYTRVMFWPSASADGDVLAWENDGYAIAVNATLTHFSDYTDANEWPRREDEEIHVAGNEREDPRTKRGILGAFCRVYDVPRALDELIPGIYVEEDGGRYHYSEGTTAGGARIYSTDDGFQAYLHSEHDSDPARGQHNVWDLVRLHLGYDGEEMETYAAQLVDVAAELKAQVEGEFEPVEDEPENPGLGRYDWLKPWLYVKSAGQFYCQPDGFYVGAGNFDAIHAVDAVRVSGKSKRGVANLTASEIALQQRPIQQVSAVVYRPGAGPVFEDNGRTYANGYRDDGAPPLDSGEHSTAVKLFGVYLDNILPNPDDQAKLLDWLAHVVRYPSRRLMYALLLRGAEGDGKTLIAELLRLLVGPSNWGLVTNDEINEKYSAWMENRRVVCAEEIKQHGVDALDVINRLKPKITNSHIAVRAMRQDSRVIDNYANLYLTTNFSDAIPLTINDTRFLVLSTRFNSKEEVEAWCTAFQDEQGFAFYPTMWRTLCTVQGAGELRQWLDNRSFSRFYNPDSRAPDTIAKTIMVESARSEADQALMELLEDEREHTINNDFVIWSHFVMRALARGYALGDSLKGRAVSSFMSRHGYIRSFQLRDGGNRLQIWVKNRGMLDKNDSSLLATGLRTVKVAMRKHAKSEFE
jgi:hypothetical protein